MSVDATDIDCPYEYLKARYNKTVLRNNAGFLMNSGDIGICDDGSLFFQNLEETSISLVDAKKSFGADETNAYVNDDNEIVVEINGGQHDGFSYNLNNPLQAQVFAAEMGVDSNDLKKINKLNERDFSFNKFFNKLRIRKIFKNN